MSLAVTIRERLFGFHDRIDTKRMCEFTPAIAGFSGIVIKMYYRSGDHNQPHIHALYGEYMGVITIQIL
ncbi:MAG: DUF4160 domain-containing protein [Polyangiaceae bacterium]|nr:DUF4160 domain-containing protein [Polyangiaceae bacterium]